jgi:hypothetical protein
MPTIKPKKLSTKLKKAPEAVTVTLKGASVGSQLGKPKMPKMAGVLGDEGMMALKPVKPTPLK